MRSLRIGFTSPQGGAGVSVLTVALASRLHYYHNIPVAVADCDIKKHSCISMRENEDVTTAIVPIYDIVGISTEEIGNGEIIDGQKSLSEGGNGPVVTLFDLGGSMDMEVLAKMDYVYIPVFQSTTIGEGISSILHMAEEFYKAKSDTKFRLFLNKCKPAEPGRLWDLIIKTGMTPCDQILITEIRIMRRLAFSTNIYHDKIAIPTIDTLDHAVVCQSNMYHLETKIIRDIRRKRLWKRQ